MIQKKTVSYQILPFPYPSPIPFPSSASEKAAEVIPVATSVWTKCNFNSKLIEADEADAEDLKWLEDLWVSGTGNLNH